VESNHCESPRLQVWSLHTGPPKIIWAKNQQISRFIKAKTIFSIWTNIYGAWRKETKMSRNAEINLIGAAISGDRTCNRKLHKNVTVNPPKFFLFIGRFKSLVIGHLREHFSNSFISSGTIRIFDQFEMTQSIKWLIIFAVSSGMKLRETGKSINTSSAGKLKIHERKHKQVV